MKKTRRRKPQAKKTKVKIKTKVYVGNPGKRAVMDVDSLSRENEQLKRKVDSLENSTIKIKIKI